MKRLRITEHIEYLRPENEISRFLCSGMIVRGSGKAFFDTNCGEVETRELLLSEKPDFAFISHYHTDHSIWGELVGTASNADLFVPLAEKDYLERPDLILEMIGSAPESERWRRFVLEQLRFNGCREFRTYDESFTLDLKKTKHGFHPGPRSFTRTHDRLLP
jgi:hypothetical protein